MFGFGWVRTHLGVVFGDDFRLFWGFWKNGLNPQNLGNFGGPTLRCRVPTYDVAERGLGQASGTP